MFLFRRVFMSKEPLLTCTSVSESSNFARRWEHTVAGDQDEKGILVQRIANCSRCARLADGLGNVFVCACRPVGNLLYTGENLFLERSCLYLEREIKGCTLSCKIFFELFCCSRRDVLWFFARFYSYCYHLALIFRNAYASNRRIDITYGSTYCVFHGAYYSNNTSVSP